MLNMVYSRKERLWEGSTLQLAYNGNYLTEKMVLEKIESMTRCLGDAEAGLIASERSLLAALKSDMLGKVES